MTAFATAAQPFATTTQPFTNQPATQRPAAAGQAFQPPLHQRSAVALAGEFALAFPGPFGSGFFGSAFGGDFVELFGATPANAPQAGVRGEVDQFVLALHEVAQRIDQGEPGAEAALRRLLARLQGHADPRCLGLYVFGAALATRLARAAGGAVDDEANLYLQRFEVPQIHLFNLLGRVLPFASLATRIANRAISNAIAGQAHPTVIDLGIGTGRQMAALMDSLALDGRLPPALTLVGIEPSGWALQDARDQLTATAQRLGTKLHFVGIEGCAETMAAADWERVAQACSGRPVINASFALHHVADDDQGRDQRNAVLRRLHALNPRLFVLSEPDVDHLEPRFFQRFLNCLRHFGAIFATLDQLPMAQADRDALKVGFFGREIADILATPEGQRSERHESAAMWAQRLEASGFRTVGAGALPNSPHPAVQVMHRGQRVALQADDEPVVSVFLAVPIGHAVA